MRAIHALVSFRRGMIDALQGVSIGDKVRLIVFRILWMLQGIKLPLIRGALAQITNIIIRGVLVYFKGSRYCLIDATTAYYFFERRHESWMWNYLASLKEDDVFVDVGAHIGLYSIYAGHLLKQGKVIAIEPNPETFNFLRKNIELNSLRNVLALNIAAWKEDGELPLYIADSSALHSLKPSIGSKRVYIVKARKLESVLSELGIYRVSFIKIDVVGAEVEVLEGLRSVLKLHKPRLVIDEVTNINVVRHFLEDLGYSISMVPRTKAIYAYPR
jgi:FkbM family methyltransferase